MTSVFAHPLAFMLLKNIALSYNHFLPTINLCTNHTDYASQFIIGTKPAFGPCKICTLDLLPPLWYIGGTLLLPILELVTLFSSIAFFYGNNFHCHPCAHELVIFYFFELDLASRGGSTFFSNSMVMPGGHHKGQGTIPSKFSNIFAPPTSRPSKPFQLKLWNWWYKLSDAIDIERRSKAFHL
jgi:hypothetical protein